MRVAFYTVTDRDYFAGTLAAISSVRLFHPDRPVHVVANPKKALRPDQDAHLRSLGRVVVHDAAAVAGPDRFVNGWELKAYVAEFLAGDHDVLVGFDSDLVLCGPVDDLVERCHAAGVWQGGRDGEGCLYGDDYGVYGMATPSRNRKYMSTSIFTIPCSAENRRLLTRWSDCCSAAIFNGRGPHPGHGDQGVLNALLFAEDRSAQVELLDNDLWSQHALFWTSRHVLDGRGRFVNLGAGGEPQRAFHSVGRHKFWEKPHRDRACGEYGAQSWPYVWFLAMLWFGPARCWDRAPAEWLPENCEHLADDLANFFPQIAAALPSATRLWHGAPPALLEAIRGPGGGGLPARSLGDLLRVARRHPAPRRVAAVGPDGGGTALALAVGLMNRDADVFAVETGGESPPGGGADGASPLTHSGFLKQIRRLPGVRARRAMGDAATAAARCADGSLDVAYLDLRSGPASAACRLNLWRPKLARGGLLCGSGYDRPEVRAAIEAQVPRVEVEPGGSVWWNAV